MRYKVLAVKRYLFATVTVEMYLAWGHIYSTAKIVKIIEFIFCQINMTGYYVPILRDNEAPRKFLDYSQD